MKFKTNLSLKINLTKIGTPRIRTYKKQFLLYKHKNKILLPTLFKLIRISTELNKKYLRSVIKTDN